MVATRFEALLLAVIDSATRCAIARTLTILAFGSNSAAASWGAMHVSRHGTNLHQNPLANPDSVFNLKRSTALPSRRERRFA